VSAIAGVVRVDGAPVDADAADRLRRATPRPGRDGVDTWREGPAALLRFALRTTPESLAETQPCPLEGDDALIVMDGRLDNRAEILARLGRAAPPAAAPDAQIVLAALVRLGEGVLPELAGDFALAVWRPGARRLFCARSNGGWRPLLWAFDGATFGFATEPRTLVDGMPLERRLNEGFVGEYLALRVTHPTETFWRGVHRLPPGYCLTLEHGEVRTRRWYEGPFEDFTDLSEADHIDRFRELLDQSLVSVHRAAGRVAAQLSGGLDSSTVVSRSLELHRAGRIDASLQPISMRFAGQACDEGAWIEAVEGHTGVRSIPVAPRAFDVAQAADWCRTTLHLPLRPNVLCTDVPLGDLLASQGARVLLTGEGGDDWLSGSHAHWPDLLLRGRWGRLAQETFGRRPDLPLLTNLRAIAAEAVGPVISPARRERLLRPNLVLGTQPLDWLRPEWVARIGLMERSRTGAEAAPAGSFAHRQRYHTSTFPRRHINLDNTLSYVASQGVELRHPLHDQRLVRFFMACDGGVLRRGTEKKHLLREAMRGTLPEMVRTRQTKANMSITILEAVRRRLAERPIEELAGVKLGWIDPAKLRETHETVGAWIEAGASGPTPGNYGVVWNAVSIDLWLEHAFGL
jgi:asparagine synthase (glutamine-hydrolysing)